MRSRYTWLVALVVVAGVAYWYFKGQGEVVQSPLERTSVVERGDLVVSISATGVIQPVELVEVKSKASGEILELPIQEGDMVHKGDLVARLDPVLVKNAYDQAEADFNVAQVTRDQRKTELDRQQGLFDRNLVPKSDLDNARLAYEESMAQLVRARSALNTVKDQLEDTEIRAPIDGIVLSRPVEAGQIISSGTTTVTGGTLLCSIANMNRVYVMAMVDETDIGKVNVGMQAEVRPEAYPNDRLKGEVLRVAPQAKVQQNVTLFEVTCLVDNTQGLLKSGMNSTVEIVMAAADDVLTVPARAVSTTPPRRHDTAQGGARAAEWHGGAQGQGQGWQGKNGPDAHAHTGESGSGRAWLQVRQNGSLEWKQVEVGLANLDKTEIRSGVAEGDTVVYQLVSGAIQARDDMKAQMRNRGPVGDMRRSGS